MIAFTNGSLHFPVYPRNFSKRGESFAISRIGSKIKGVFKSTTMEGAMLPPSAMNDFDDDAVSVYGSLSLRNQAGYILT